MTTQTIEEIADAIGTVAITATTDGETRRAAVKLAAERFGFTVTDTNDIAAAAAELGIEL